MRDDDAAPDDTFVPGTLLGTYALVRKLGTEQRGTVYEAVHTGIGKPVAVKILSPALATDPEAERQFLREAAAACRLSHPHIVDVSDFGTAGGVTYLVMEFLRGQNLAEHLGKAGFIPLPQLADWMVAICAGVFAGHEAGVVHRNLVPRHIFLARTPLGDVVPKVLPFGVSRMVGDARSDQTAVGTILYECATGTAPHGDDRGNVVPPRELRPELPAAFESLVLRALSGSRPARFESVHDLGRALLPFASARQQLIWSDYFERDRAPVQASAAAAGQHGTPRPPSRRDLAPPRTLPETPMATRRRGGWGKRLAMGTGLLLLLFSGWALLQRPALPPAVMRAASPPRPGNLPPVPALLPLAGPAAPAERSPSPSWRWRARKDSHGRRPPRYNGAGVPILE